MAALKVWNQMSGTVKMAHRSTIGLMPQAYRLIAPNFIESLKFKLLSLNKILNKVFVIVLKENELCYSIV